MPGESFTYVGMQFFPVGWVLWALMLVLLPVGFRVLGRIPVFFYFAAAIGLGVALVPLPDLLTMALDFPLMLVSTFFVVAESAKKRTGKKISFMPCVALFVPTFISPLTMFVCTGVGRKNIWLSGADMETIGSPSISLNRADLDIRFETAWLGPGYDWGFQDRKGRHYIIGTADVFWSNRSGMVTGDEVARRIERWSGSKPRFCRHWESVKWVQPEKEAGREPRS